MLNEANKALKINGKIIIMGGEVNATSDGYSNVDAVWAEIIHMSGGKKIRVGVIAVASSHGKKTAEDVVSFFKIRAEKLCGIKNEDYAIVIPIFMSNKGDDCEMTKESKENNWQTAVFDEKNVQLIESCNAIYFLGGDQSRYVKALRKDGKDTPVLKAIWRVYKNGGVIIGTSAGAAVISKMMFGGGDSYGAMRHYGHGKTGVLERDAGGSELWLEEGFGFVEDVLIDTHFLERGRIARMIIALIHTKKRIGIGIEEATALIIDEFGICKSVGQSAVIIVDAKELKYDLRDRFLDVSGIRIHMLDQGDEFDFNKFEVVNWIDNEEVINNENARFSRPLLTSDILAPDVFFKALVKFTDNYKKDKIESLAVDFDGYDPHRRRFDAYRFIFEKDHLTKAWKGFNKGVDSYCISNVLLKIKALEIECFNRT